MNRHAPIRPAFSHAHTQTNTLAAHRHKRTHSHTQTHTNVHHAHTVIHTRARAGGARGYMTEALAAVRAAPRWEMGDWREGESRMRGSEQLRKKYDDEEEEENEKEACAHHECAAGCGGPPTTASHRCVYAAKRPPTVRVCVPALLACPALPPFPRISSLLLSFSPHLTSIDILLALLLLSHCLASLLLLTSPLLSSPHFASSRAWQR